MATVIAPSLGTAPLFTQGGTGITPGYSAIDRRRAYTSELQAGVIGSTDFKVVQRGAGANMTVDVTMTAGGVAYVAGTAVSGQGLYAVPVHASTVNEAVAAAHGSLPRIDTVVLRVFDHTHDASGANNSQIVVLTGTATSGATLDNRTGAATVPGSSLVLADILVPAASSSVVTANIRDRRSWARGAYRQILGGSTEYTTSSAVTALISSANLTERIECSGAPLIVQFATTLSLDTVTTVGVIELWLDGSKVSGTNSYQWVNPTAGVPQSVTYTWVFAPTAGSHVIGPAFRVSSGFIFRVGSSSTPSSLIIQEQLRQNVGNS